MKDQKDDYWVSTKISWTTLKFLARMTAYHLVEKVSWNSRYLCNNLQLVMDLPD